MSLYVVDSELGENTPLIAGLLAPHIHRFRSLELRVPADFLAYMGSLDLPILEELTVRLGDNPNSPPNFRAFPVLHMPSIRRVTLGQYVDLDDALSLPLSELQELHLQCTYTLDKLLIVLRQCTNLREFSVVTYVFPVDPPLEPDNQLVTLPELCTLALRAEDLTVRTLLQNLTVPKLQKLIIHPSLFLDQWDEASESRDRELYPMLSAMVNRSSCILKSFDFPRIYTSYEELVDCLLLMPDLTTLVLGGDYLGSGSGDYSLREPLLQLLTPTTDTSSAFVLPNLRHIKVLDCRGFSDKMLLDFIHSRRQSAPPGISQLSRVFVRRWDTGRNENDLCPEFLALREDGLELTVITDPPVGVQPPIIPVSSYNSMEGMDMGYLESLLYAYPSQDA